MEIEPKIDVTPRLVPKGLHRQIDAIPFHYPDAVRDTFRAVASMAVCGVRGHAGDESYGE